MQYQVPEGHKRLLWQILTQTHILRLWYPKYIFYLPSMLTPTPQRDILWATHKANWLVICIADTSNLSSLRYIFFLIFKWNNPNLLFYLSGNVFLLSQGGPWTCTVWIQSQEAGLFKQHQKVRTQISLFGSTPGQGDLGSLALVTDGAPLMYLWGFITSKPSLPGKRIPAAGTVLFFQRLNKEVKGLWGIKKSPGHKHFTQLWLLHQTSAFQSEAPWQLLSLSTHHALAYFFELAMTQGVSVRKNSALPRTSPPLNPWKVYTKR